MKFRSLHILLIFFSMQMCFAQKIEKPKVLIYGSGIMAYSAAVQAAQSNVPTLWVLQTDDLVPEFTTASSSIETLSHVDGGIWLQILMSMAMSKSPNDSLAAVVKKDLNPRLFRNAVEKNNQNASKLNDYA